MTWFRVSDSSKHPKKNSKPLSAVSGNRTQGSTMATLNFTTKPILRWTDGIMSEPLCQLSTHWSIITNITCHNLMYFYYVIYRVSIPSNIKTWFHSHTDEGVRLNFQRQLLSFKPATVLFWVDLPGIFFNFVCGSWEKTKWIHKNLDQDFCLFSRLLDHFKNHKRPIAKFASLIWSICNFPNLAMIVNMLLIAHLILIVIGRIVSDSNSYPSRLSTQSRS